MNKFTYSYPTKVYFGEGAAAQALEAELGKIGKTVMLAYGGGSIKKNGVYDELIKLLSQAGKEVVEFSGITSNPKYSKVQEGAKLAKDKNVDFILAVGGGSVIDCCKVVSAQAKIDEDIWDMEYKSGKFPTDGVPMGAVVTASGTGAEMNSGAVITVEDKKWKGPIVGSAAAFRGSRPGVYGFRSAYAGTLGRVRHLEPRYGDLFGKLGRGQRIGRRCARDNAKHGSQHAQTA